MPAPTCDPRAVEEAARRYQDLHEGYAPDAVECVALPEQPRFLVELGPKPEDRYTKEVRENGVVHSPLYRHEYEEHARPTLVHDDQGRLHYMDGAYTTTAHGIEDVPMRSNSSRRRARNNPYEMPTGVPYARSSQTSWRSNPAPAPAAFPAPGAPYASPSAVPDVEVVGAGAAYSAEAQRAEAERMQREREQMQREREQMRQQWQQRQAAQAAQAQPTPAAYGSERERAERDAHAAEIRAIEARKRAAEKAERAASSGRTFLDDAIVAVLSAAGLTVGGALVLQQTNWAPAGKSALVGALGLGVGFLTGANQPALALGMIAAGAANLGQAVFQTTAGRPQAQVSTQQTGGQLAASQVSAALPADATPSSTV